MRLQRTPLITLLVLAAVLAIAPARTGHADDAAMLDLVGRTKAQAMASLSAQGIEPELRLLASDQVDLVLEQSPAPGAALSAETEVTLVVGTRRVIRTVVPTVVGMTEADMRDAVSETYFLEVRYASEPATERGKVVSQDPASGTQLYAHERFVVTVVRGGAIVPAVIGTSESAARAALRGAGFEADVRYVADASVEDGTVLAQDPRSGTEALSGTQVRLGVARASAGPDIGVPPGGDSTPGGDPFPGDPMPGDPFPGEPVPPSDVVIPDVRGLSLEAARSMSINLGLQMDAAYVEAAAAAHSVVAQRPLAGERVAIGSVLQVDVARPPAAPTHVRMPSVVGLSRGQAVSRLQSAGLAPQVAFSLYPGRRVGTVRRQHPNAGSLVLPGSDAVITLPRSAEVPHLVGRTRSQARGALQGVGLQAEPVRVGPAGGSTTRVVSQTEPAGSIIAKGSRVRFRYEHVATGVVIPPVAGSSLAAATSQLEALGFHVTPQNLGGIGPFKRAESTNPGAGSTRPHGSTVRVRYRRNGLTLVPRVPNVVDRTLGQAQASLQARGYVVLPQMVGGAGTSTKVISTIPSANSPLAAGSTVRVRYRKVLVIAGLLVRVPNLSGKSKNQAKSMLQAAGLRWSWTGNHSSPFSRVDSQSRAANSLVARNTRITVRFKMALQIPGGGIQIPGGGIQIPGGGLGGLLLKNVPSVMGQLGFQARLRLQNAGFTVRTTRMPGAGPSPLLRVRSQSPNGGTRAARGSRVTIVLGN